MWVYNARLDTKLNTNMNNENKITSGIFDQFKVRMCFRGFGVFFLSVGMASEKSAGRGGGGGMNDGAKTKYEFNPGLTVILVGE